ncbi:MAG: hypothetical protein ABMB14_00640 [Myxococcota bacterium]
MRAWIAGMVVAGAGCAAVDPTGPGTSTRSSDADADIDADPDPVVDPDTDGDGLSDGLEAALGSDPAAPDTDADRLGDGDEHALGTDLRDPDTDHDGYADGDEVAEGVDPLDPDDRIYVGGWPYDPDKDALADPGFGGAIAVGATFPDLVAPDQFGDDVHLYDFAGEMVMIEFATVWCTPCNAWAAYLLGDGPDPYFDYPNLREAVQTGAVRWITVLIEDELGQTPLSSDAAAWAENHPNPAVPVLAPGNPSASVHYTGLGGFPTMVWLDPDLTVQAYDVEENAVTYEAAKALEAALTGPARSGGGGPWHPAGGEPREGRNPEACSGP